MDADTRVDPPFVAPEKELLEAFLDYHRETLVWKVSGLSDDNLRKKMTPSGLSLLGLVKHLAYVERWWFQVVLMGVDFTAPWSKEDPDADFRIESNETLESVLKFYRDEVAQAKANIAKKDLDDLVVRRDNGREYSVRWIMLHMIEEVARHNGHADIFREAIDGEVGE